MRKSEPAVSKFYVHNPKKTPKIQRPLKIAKRYHVDSSLKIYYSDKLQNAMYGQKITYSYSWEFLSTVALFGLI